VSSTPYIGLSASDLVVARPEGLYCPAGNFYIDPWLRSSSCKSARTKNDTAGTICISKGALSTAQKSLEYQESSVRWRETKQMLGLYKELARPFPFQAEVLV